MLLQVTEQAPGVARVDLGGYSTTADAADLARDGMIAASVGVAELVGAGGFADELTGRQGSWVRRYGRTLWDWLTRDLPAGAVNEFVDDPTIEVGDAGWLQDLSWELLNCGDEATPQWLALQGHIRRVRDRETDPAPGPASGALLVTARPYAQDDVPMDVPASAIAQACFEAGRPMPRWQPAASAAALDSVPAAGRLLLLHLDMHGVRLRDRADDGHGTPHLLLESPQGTRPVRISEILTTMGGPPPRTVLLTSCEADVAGIPQAHTVQADAHAAGVDHVIASRRKLTPEEVSVFSQACYAGGADESDVEGAVLAGRRALAARTEAGGQVGAFAWASFTLSSVRRPCATAVITTSAAPAAPPPAVPGFLGWRQRGVGLVVIQGDASDYLVWKQRLAWWAASAYPAMTIAEHAGGIGDFPPVGAFAPGSVRLHDWTAITTPADAIRLQAGRDGRPLGLVPAGVDGVLDVVVARCAPQLLVHAGPATLLLPAEQQIAWRQVRQAPGLTPFGRWLAGTAEVDPAQAARTATLPVSDRDEEAAGILEALVSLVTSQGYTETDLLVGLASCTAGVLSTTTMDAPPAEYAVIRAFADACVLAGVACRRRTGRWRLDLFAPRLATAIRFWVHSHEARAHVGSWLDWSIRLAAAAPEFVWRPGHALPHSLTLGDRLLRPDRVLGPDVARVAARNHLFHAAVRSQLGSPEYAWWEGLGKSLDAPDRACVGAVHEAVTLGPRVKPETPETKAQRWASALAGAKRMHAAATSAEPGERFHFVPRGENDPLGVLVRPDQTPAKPATPPLPLAELAHMVLETPPTSDWHLYLPGGNGALIVLGTPSITADGGESEEGFRDFLRYVVWPEDRGTLLNAAARSVLPHDEHRYRAFADEAIGALLVGESPRCLSIAINIMHVKAALARKTGRWTEWDEIIELAVRLIRGVDWGPIADAVGELLEEVGRGSLDRQLRLTAQLMRSAASRNPAELTSLITHRGMALMRADRIAEGVELFARADTSVMTDKDRSILLVYQAEAALHANDLDTARRFCTQLQAFATGSVLAHTYFILARAAAKEDDMVAALQANRLAAHVDGGGEYADNAAIAYCMGLVPVDLDLCDEETARVRTHAAFPYSARACLIAAIALLHRNGNEETEAVRDLVGRSMWANASDDQVYYHSLLAAGHADLVNEVGRETHAAATRWILGDMATLPPPEVRVGPQEFTTYYMQQLLSQPEAFYDNADTFGWPSDGALDEFCRYLLHNAGIVMQLADGLWDAGSQRAAAHWLRQLLEKLSDERLSNHPDQRVMQAYAAFTMGSFLRGLGRPDECVRWAEASAEWSRGPYSPHISPDLARTGARLPAMAIELAGNAYHDMREYDASRRCHLQALRLRIGLAPEVDIEDALYAALVAEEHHRSSLVTLLFNLGNSLQLTDPFPTYAMARLIALMIALSLPDIEQMAARPSGRFVLNGLVLSFEQQIGEAATPDLPEMLATVRRLIGR